MKVIGLTGGIGSGKTSASNYLEKKGITVIDADKISREIVEPGKAALNEIVLCFGNEILNEDGTLNRKALGDIIFHDKEKRATLNKIMHSKVLLEIKHQLKELREKIVVVDAPLLIETGIDQMMDEIWVLNVHEKVQIHRIKKRDKLSDAEIEARMKAQLLPAERNKFADVILDNSGDLKDLYKQIDEALIKIDKRYKIRDKR